MSVMHLISTADFAHEGRRKQAPQSKTGQSIISLKDCFVHQVAVVAKNESFLWRLKLYKKFWNVLYSDRNVEIA